MDRSGAGTGLDTCETGTAPSREDRVTVDHWAGRVPRACPLLIPQLGGLAGRSSEAEDGRPVSSIRAAG